MLGNLGVSSLCPEKCLGLQNVPAPNRPPSTVPHPLNRYVPPRRRCKCVACSLGSKNIHISNHYNAIWVFPKIVGFPPKSSMFNKVFHYFHHPFWGARIFGNIHLSEIEPKKKTAMTQPTESTRRKFSVKHHSLVQTFGSPWFLCTKVRDEHFPIFFGKKNLGHWMPGDNPPGAQGLPGLLVGLNVGATSRCNTTCHQEGNDYETTVKWCLKW